jgi:hypothetical protein
MTSGTFAVSFRSQLTAAVSAGAAPSALKAALEALTRFGQSWCAAVVCRHVSVAVNGRITAPPLCPLRGV